MLVYGLLYNPQHMGQLHNVQSVTQSVPWRWRLWMNELPVADVALSMLLMLLLLDPHCCPVAP
jgi:hypothetical protein